MYALAFYMVISDLQKYYGEPYNKAYYEIKELLKKNGFYFPKMFLSSFVVSVIPLLNFVTLVQIIVTNGSFLEESLSKAFSSCINESIEKERSEDNGA